jgi:hypothetical protein
MLLATGILFGHIRSLTSLYGVGSWPFF